MTDTAKLTKQQLLELLKKHEEDEAASAGIVTSATNGSTATADTSSTPSGSSATPSSQSTASTSTASQSTASRCQFKPKKAGAQPCTEAVSTPYGYCKAHKSSVQGMSARKVYEAALFEKENAEKIRIEAEKKAELLLQEEKRREMEAAEEEKRKKEKALEEERRKKEAELKALEEEKLKKEEKNVEPKSTSSKKSSPPTSTLEFVEPPPPKKIRIRPNKWGRYEEPDSHIVFDHVEKVAIGIQDQKSGRVLALDAKAIEHCKKNLWKYKIRVAPSTPSTTSAVSPIVKSDPIPEEDENEGEEEPEDESEGDEEGEGEEEGGEDEEGQEEGDEDEEGEEGEGDEEVEDEDEEQDVPPSPPRSVRQTVADVRTPSTKYASLHTYGNRGVSPLTPKRR